MSSINVHNWNYGAKELLSKLTQILDRDSALLGVAVQRSVTCIGQLGKNEHVITVTEILPVNAGEASETVDYGRLCLRREVLSLKELLVRLGKLEAKQFIVGGDVFQFDMNFGFSDHYEASNNCYGEWPGVVFDVGANYSQLPTGPLWHPHLPSYESPFAAMREFLQLKTFNDFSDARLGHTLIYVPNLNARLERLRLQGTELGVLISGVLEPKNLILEVLYSTTDIKKRVKRPPSDVREVIQLDFVPSELRVLLFSAAGNLLDFQEETLLYSTGCNAVLPKNKPVAVTAIQAAGGIFQSIGSDPDSLEELGLSHMTIEKPVSLGSLPKKEDLLSAIESLLNALWQLAVLVIDLDNFKEVNDRNGHLAGDTCLESIVSLIGEAIVRKGTLYRWGGDEFAVVLPNFDADEARATAERIRLSIVRGSPGGEIAVTASIGVGATNRASRVSAKELLGSADNAMYASKKNGKNRVTYRPLEMKATTDPRN